MKLHLAGADSARKLVAAVAGSLAADSTATPYLLTSYWYSRLQAGDKANGLWRKLYDFVDAEWVVDSGLFTMMFGSGRGRTYDIKELRAYTAKYVRYLNEIRFRHYAVEMDVHKVLGMNAVFELRAYLEDHWPVEQTIYVWHEEEGIDGLQRLAAERPYIALSIPELRQVASKRKLDLNMLTLNLLRTINEAGSPKVHLLGCSQPSVCSIRTTRRRTRRAGPRPLAGRRCRSSTERRSARSTSTGEPFRRTSSVTSDSFARTTSWCGSS